MALITASRPVTAPARCHIVVMLLVLSLVHEINPLCAATSIQLALIAPAR
ncbi:MAG: hypothetical protein M3436_20200 [Pseudomonadota bacterium]|nr:hypothetical protein [Pseudomonadota bacterium]